MTNKERQETLERLKARLECDKRQVRGNADVCNPPYMCEECDLCYAQGTLGERNIDLARAIEAISVEAIPIEWIVNKWAKSFWKEINGKKYYMGDGYDTVWDMIEAWEAENGK